MVEVAGVRTTMGWPIFRDHMPERSAFAVEPIEARGGIVGLRSSPGRVPTGPDAVPFGTLSIEGPMARRARPRAFPRRGEAGLLAAGVLLEEILDAAPKAPVDPRLTGAQSTGRVGRRTA
jgi:hypothetical protein